MESILGSNTLLLEDSVILISVILVSGACLATLVAWNLTRRSNSRAGDSVWTIFLPTIWRSAGSLSDDKEKHRDLVEQLKDRLPVTNAPDHEQDATIVDLLSQIVDINATLHTRLENAEGTLEDQAAEISAYKSEARTDAMTGLPNRRVFDELLRDRVSAWQRNKIPFSVLLVDIDHFKRFNDNYGHLAGDEVLKQVAHVLLGSMSKNDLVARIGGE